MQDPHPIGPLLDAESTAAIIGVTVETLARWRSQGNGPAFVRLGRRHSPIRYRRIAIEQWLDAQTAHARAPGRA